MMSSFAIAKTFTPLLNTHEFRKVFGGEDGSSLPLDAQGLLRNVETIALPETKFKILKQIDSSIVQVETADYSCQPLFADLRFLTQVDEKVEERKKRLPPFSKIMEDLEKLIGTRYIWGGNWSQGIPELLQYYPPKTTLQKEMQLIWTLKGIDCSGLLYQVTEGYTPRNTSWLVHFGQPIFIENLSVEQICSSVRPLDLIVWHGHVILILDPSSCIESRSEFGVVTKNLKDRLEELISQSKKIPSNFPPPSNKDYFVIRRWI